MIHQMMKIMEVVQIMEMVDLITGTETIIMGVMATQITEEITLIMDLTKTMETIQTQITKIETTLKTDSD
jgi:hypothetical protein